MRSLRWAGIYGLCILVVLFVRIGLWVTKYQHLRRLLVRPCDPEPRPERVQTVARIGHAVNATARFIPDASCLTQCISCQAVLSWKNIPTTISIGVKKGEGETLKAHAWLMWNDQAVLDSSRERAGFNKVLDLPTAPLPAPKP